MPDKWDQYATQSDPWEQYASSSGASSVPATILNAAQPAGSTPRLIKNATGRLTGSGSSIITQAPEESGLTTGPGALPAFLSDTGELVKNAPNLFTAMAPMTVIPGHMGLNPNLANAVPFTLEADEQRKAEGRSPAYRAVAAVGQNVTPLNVTGQEESARKGDIEGVLGHTLAGLAPTVLPEVVRRTGAGALVERAAKSTSALPERITAGRVAPQQAVSSTAASMHPAAVSGSENIIRAAAPVGSDPGFRESVYSAAGDLNEIGQKIDLKSARGGTMSPDMRVRATVDGIDSHLSDMYQQERAPQIQRNAQVPVGLNNLGADETAGLNYIARNGATAADRTVAAKALNNGVLSVQELDQLSQNVSRQLQDYNSMTPQDRAQAAGLQKRIASIQALDKVVKNRLDDTLQMRGEGGVQNYRQRYAALSSVRDQLRARMNMAELQRRVPYVQGAMHAWDVLRGKISGMAGASQSAVANVNIGDQLEKGFSNLQKSGITPTRDVGTGGRPPVAGLLGPGATPPTAGGRVGPQGPTAIPLGSQMQPIGQPSAPPPTLPYQPSLQTPPQFVAPGQIKPAGPPPELLNPNKPSDFPAGQTPTQGKLFQTTVGRPAAEPQYVYRVRSIGEQGVPNTGSGSHAQATNSLEEAQKYVEGRQSFTGKRQEIVRIDLSKVPGDQYRRLKGPNGNDWIKFNKDIPESAVKAVTLGDLAWSAAQKAAPKTFQERK